MRRWTILLGVVTAAGCAHFSSQPLSPDRNAAALEGRSLTNPALRPFLEKGLQRELTHWPPAQWDFSLLTGAALFYHPDLAVARAQWGVAQAGIRTAGGRPNPTLSLTPGYDTTHSVPSPWFPAVSFDWPIETAGKRGHRIAAAERLSQSAHLNLATVAWQVRSRLRSSLLELAAARRRETLLREQFSLHKRIVNLLDQQVSAGAIARFESAPARVALEKLRLDVADAERQRAEAGVQVAAAIGVPAAALDPVELSVDWLKDPVTPADLTTAEVRRTALRSRTDILGALEDYAAAEATLQLEIAKQYPDVHLSPGYQYDLGDNKWSLGITVELPVLNQNQGAIAEARARCAEAVARFDALQAKVLADIERAVEGFRVSASNSAALRALAETQARQRESVAAQFEAGAVDPVDFLIAQSEAVASELVGFEARIKLQQAAGALEDAVQRPLERDFALPADVVGGETSQAVRTTPVPEKQP